MYTRLYKSRYFKSNIVLFMQKINHAYIYDLIQHIKLIYAFVLILNYLVCHSCLPWEINKQFTSVWPPKHSDILKVS